MGISVGSFDAKTHLSEYLERVARGESFTITRRGAPVAELRPVTSDSEELSATLGECAELRSRIQKDHGTYLVAQLVRADRDR